MTKLTMEDVAREAGVNKATVSRSLKGDPRISPATRERVWAAAKKLGYRLDISARSLSGGRTGLAALVLESTVPWLSPLFLTGLSRILTKSGMDILLKMPGFNDPDLSGSLAARHVDCILWAGSERSDIPSLSSLPRVPLLTAGFSVEDFPGVLVSENETLRRLQAIASGRPLRLVSGPSPLFPFLSRLIPPHNPSAKDSFLILDGVSPDESDVSSGCICALPDERRQAGFFRLEWPAFEMGAALGHLLAKVLSGRSVPSLRTLSVPLIREPSGEKLLFNKMNQGIF